MTNPENASILFFVFGLIAAFILSFLWRKGIVPLPPTGFHSDHTPAEPNETKPMQDDPGYYFKDVNDG